jgi:hypothetical protein
VRSPNKTKRPAPFRGYKRHRRICLVCIGPIIIISVILDLLCGQGVVEGGRRFTKQYTLPLEL